jgi:hypothetical protein
MCETCGFPNGTSPDEKKIDTSNLKNILGNHLIPSPADEAIIHKNVGKAKFDISLIDKSMAQLAEIFSRLRERRDDLQGYVDKQLSLLSPIHHLPDDVLVEIFGHCCPTDSDSYASNNPQGVQWRIAKVCKRWSHVVTSIRSIWSSINVDLTLYANLKHLSYANSLKAMARTCLIRSGRHPLCLHFAAWEINFFDRSFFNTFWRQKDRWQVIFVPDELIYYWDSEEFMDNLPSWEPASFPILKKMAVHSSPYSHRPEDLPIFRMAPQLSHLSLNAFPRPMQILTITWSQITHFSSKNGQNHSIDDYFELLQAMPHLISLTIENHAVYSINERQPPKRRVTRNRLLRLDIQTSWIPMYELLQCLEAPHLTELQLAYREGLSGATIRLIPMICEFCQLSPSLAALALSGFSPAFVNTILEYTPGIEVLDLTLQGTRVNDVLLKMTWKIGEASVLPKLHTMFVGNSLDRDAVLDLMQMVGSRFPDNAEKPGHTEMPLQRLVLNNVTSTWLELDALKRFVNNLGGVVMEIGTWTPLHYGYPRYSGVRHGVPVWVGRLNDHSLTQFK